MFFKISDITILLVIGICWIEVASGLTAGEMTTLCECEETGTNINYPGDIYKYITCSTAGPQENVCGADSLGNQDCFSKSDQECIGDCTSIVDGGAGEFVTISTEEMHRLCTGKNMRLVPYPGNQKWFIVCLNSGPQKMCCKQPTTGEPACFKESEQACTSDCAQGQDAAYNTFITNYCKTNELWLTTMPAEDCRHYYMCMGADRAPIYDSCPGEQHFSHEHKRCMAPHEAGCVRRDQLCTLQEDGYKFPSSANCYEYFECDKKVPLQKSCKYAEHFDAVSGRCISARGSKCVDAVPRVPSCSAKDTGLYLPHAECQKFYICINSVAFEAQCATDQYFDERYGVCKRDVQGVCA